LPNQDNARDVFFILDSAQLHQSLAIVENNRQELPQLKIDMDLKVGSFKSQFKKADKSGAKVAIIIGQEELDNGFAGIKFLQQN
ncbi:His/Gly/Thr/Pro-type tRNA ligase C-terminal domain-containing protein, partial [Francisella tularensis subsp. holarctica]|uniref:His/Gly/Thr/Pro-type tRNA ligase C-terminal domain-containing protein n=1 Tax=Francisella tularensis TaxID=263 RepID=UPI002381B2D2